MSQKLKAELAALYLNYINNYLTMEYFAGDNSLSLPQATALINLGRQYHEESI